MELNKTPARRYASYQKAMNEKAANYFDARGSLVTPERKFVLRDRSLWHKILYLNAWPITLRTLESSATSRFTNTCITDGALRPSHGIC